MLKLRSGYNLIKWAYDDMSNRQVVRRAYLSLLKNPDVRPLTKSETRRIKEYAVGVFGSNRFYPWLEFYAAYRGEFVEGWIPNDFFKLVLPKINHAYLLTGSAKTLSRQILATDKIPDIAYFINGSWFDRNGERTSVERLRELIFDESDSVFIKREESNRGRGIHIISREHFDYGRLAHLGNFVVQRPIIQHRWFEQIFPACVATLRVTTGVPWGATPRKCAAYLRLGQGNATFISSARALKVPILDDDGTLGDFASDVNWRRYSHHPDTNFAFARQKVPFFREAADTCEQLHGRVPQYGIIGWDVGITNTGGIEIMEFNTGYPSIKFTEAAIGPCLRDLNLEQYTPASRGVKPFKYLQQRSLPAHGSSV